MFIRPMDIGDLKRIMELEHLLFTSVWNEEDFIYEITDNPFSFYYVLEDENRIVGYVGLWVMYEQSQITTIGIDPCCQRKGYGQYLLNEMIHLAISKECEVMSLEVRVSNSKAIGLYEKFGFVKEGIRKDYYQDNHEDAYLYVKRLEANA